MKLMFTFALLVMATSVAAQPALQTVVFVCEHGAVKSVVAAAQFNKLASERGLPFRAVSRGTAPDPAVPPRIAEGLKGEGLVVPAGFSPALVSSTDVKTAVRVVMFDVTLPVSAEASRLTRWDGLPAFSDDYAPASSAIAAKVDALLRELQAATQQKHQ